MCRCLYTEAGQQLEKNLMCDVTVGLKIDQINRGELVVMSDIELDWMIDKNLDPDDIVSMPNPHQVGTLDAYLVGKKSTPLMSEQLLNLETLTSAARAEDSVADSVWDEPAGASTARGWYWPVNSTQRSKTMCAGHYLDYGAKHKRFDDKQGTEPGSIHCVVVEKTTGRTRAARYVATPEQGRTWIEQEARKAGY